MKIAHIITDLNVGGAQVMLHQLLRHTDRTAFQSEVISLTDKGPLTERIAALGVPISAMGMRSGIPDPRGVLRLAGWLRQSRPDVVQTWLYQGDLIGGLAARLAGNRAIAWGVHSSLLDARITKQTVLWTIKACARLSSYLPQKIVCCAETSQRLHAEMGYPAEKLVVIPNGFDLEHYKPDAAARRSVRQDLGIPEAMPLIGLIGRFHPEKDHENFIRAAALLHQQLPEAGFLLCGTDIDWENQALAGWIKEASLQHCFYLLGRRQDVPRIYTALDILALSSYSEAFPMVAGEAMACGIPCVLTNVGDAALIVGETGLIVPAKNPRALANAWFELINLGIEKRRELGKAARQRIEKHYSIAQSTTRYENLYREMTRMPGHSVAAIQRIER